MRQIVHQTVDLGAYEPARTEQLVAREPCVPEPGVDLRLAQEVADGRTLALWTGCEPAFEVVQGDATFGRSPRAWP